jgi:ABC-type transport system involved in multi-copper enzyme maturation permease subunit
MNDRTSGAFRAELMKLRRPKMLAGFYGAMVGFSVLATTLAFLVAKDRPQVFNGDRPGAVGFSLADLTGSAGATRGFVLGAGFVGVIVLVMFAVSIASEHSYGTLRTLALFEPRRLRLLAGKIAALVVFVAIGYALAEVAGILTAYIAAGIKGVPVHAWTTGAGLQSTASAFGDAVLSGIGWGLLGMMAAIAFRTLPITLAVMLAWVFPFENIMFRSWAAADRWFPGLLLQGVGSGSGGSGGWTRAVLMTALYAGLFLAASSLIFRRRDITA